MVVLTDSLLPISTSRFNVTEIVPLIGFDEEEPVRALSGRADISLLPTELMGGAISIGNFDGVHLGHSALLGQLRDMADKLGGPAIAVTFDPHPVELLRPEFAPTPLTNMQMRADRMQPLGIDALVVCQTSQSLLKRSAKDFFDAVISRRLGAKGIVEGPNFYFGRDRGGDIQLLEKLATASGMQFQIAEPREIEGLMISSSEIRSSLTKGDVQRASLMIGCPHQIVGTVTTGAQRGRTIGFPTANLSEVKQVIPALGVYAGWSEISGTPLPAAIHIGPNPTFESNETVKVEVHLLDYAGDLYGKEISVGFTHRIRDIKKFESIEELTRQLQQDVEQVRTVLSQ